MARAVVTGAAGFIGSHLVARLMRAGHEVWMVDDLSTGRMENIAAATVEGGGGRTKFFHVDIADSEDLNWICSGADYIFHLAALADIVPSITEPTRYHRSNVEGTVRLLEAIRASGRSPRVVYAASSSCYGVPDELPTPETADIRPEYPYALTKNVAEQYVLSLGVVIRHSRGESAVFSTSTVLGRGQPALTGRFSASFSRRKLAGRPMTIVGDGTQTRDFVYVTDVAEACLRAGESSLAGEIMNVGAGRPQSVNRLCELLGGPTVHVPKRPGEPDCTWSDCSKIKRLLDWSPTVSFEEGVERMLASIDAWRGAPVWTPDSIAEATKEWFHCLAKREPCHA